MVLAIAAQAVIMLLLTYVLLASDRKGQSLASVAIAAVLSTALARSSFWNVKVNNRYALGPILAGVLSFALGLLWHDGFAIGQAAVPNARRCRSTMRASAWPRRSPATGSAPGITTITVRRSWRV